LKSGAGRNSGPKPRHANTYELEKTSIKCQKQQRGRRGPSYLIRQYPINSLYLSVDAMSETTMSVTFNFTIGGFSVDAITIKDAALFLLKWTQLIYQHGVSEPCKMRESFILLPRIKECWDSAQRYSACYTYLGQQDEFTDNDHQISEVYPANAQSKLRQTTPKLEVEPGYRGFLISTHAFLIVETSQSIYKSGHAPSN
jgi:hypothetical protein